MQDRDDVQSRFTTLAQDTAREQKAQQDRIQGLQAELERVTARLEHALTYRNIQLDPVSLDTLVQSAKLANKPLDVFTVELLSYALQERQGRVASIPVSQEVYARFVALAEGRNCPLHMVTSSEDASEWFRQGFENQKY